MVIIRVNRDDLESMSLEHLQVDITVQALRGVIILPPWCELLSEVPMSEGIQIVQQKEDARVAELEKELAAALDWIKGNAWVCSTCKHEQECAPEYHGTVHMCARCKVANCICKTCINGSNWEWRGHNAV